MAFTRKTRGITWIGHSRPVLVVGVITLALALCVPLPLGSAGRAAAAPSGQFSTTGQTANASASGFDSTSGIGFDIGVFQDGSTSVPQSWLFYDIYQIDASGNFSLLENGFGSIPSTALQVAGGARPTTITLKTDTSVAGNPSFTRYAGAGGAISITWTATSDFWSTSSGGNKAHIGKYIVYQTSGSSYYSTATAQGTLIGLAVPDPSTSYNYASVGSSQGVSVCRACSP